MKRSVRVNRLWIILVMSGTLLIILSACNLPFSFDEADVDELERDAQDEDFLAVLGDDWRLVVEPNYYCPGELVTVEWFAEQTTLDCLGSNEPPCRIAGLSASPIHPIEFSSNPFPDAFEGSESFVIAEGEGLPPGTFTFFYDVVQRVEGDGEPITRVYNESEMTELAEAYDFESNSR